MQIGWLCCVRCRTQLQNMLKIGASLSSISLLSFGSNFKGSSAGLPPRDDGDAYRICFIVVQCRGWTASPSLRLDIVIAG